MVFNSVDFLLFFPIAVLGYYIVPRRIKYIWLLLCSYYFYMCWNPKYVFLLMATTIITYVCGIVIESVKWKRLCVLICLIANLGLLGYFKYTNFFLKILGAVTDKLGFGIQVPQFDILLPVGISFYTFQALSYIIDVYRGEIQAEKNILRYALFVSFWPQLVAGPIERSSDLMSQLKTPKPFCYGNLKKGLLIMLWGFFLKVVIADRAAILVNAVYNDSATYHGLFIVIATLFFSIQIYCDFCGYSTIARGAALVMGIRLTDNFCAPYLSQSVKEFWRRWHISLSAWFRDYVYIPLGGSRKGGARKEINRLIVFATSGLWHGASLAFVFWGILNGIYQVVEDIWEKIKFSRRQINYLGGVMSVSAEGCGGDY